MKTTSPTVHLYLRVAKKLKDGTHPIMLKVNWKGAIERSTGFACKKKDWDTKREGVKASFPNAREINRQLLEKKNRLIERVYALEKSGSSFTLSDIVDDKATTAAPSSITDFIAAYQTELHLGHTTAEGYTYLGNILRQYNMLKPSDISPAKLAQHLEEKGLKDGTIRTIMARLKAITNYMLEQGALTKDPFYRYNYCKKFNVSKSTRYIHYQTVEVMKEVLLNELTSDRGSMWTYKDNAMQMLADKHGKVFSLLFWLLGYTFQGMAPIDLCLLKKKDLPIKRIGGVDYYCYDGKRRKTNVKFSVRIKAHTKFANAIIRGLLMANDGELFLPVLNNVENNFVKQARALNNFLRVAKRRLDDWFREINQLIIARNVETGEEIPLIDMNCTIYSYRHSFAMMYMAKGGNPLALATLLGRSVNTLATYVQQLSEENDLVSAVSVMSD